MLEFTYTRYYTRTYKKRFRKIVESFEVDIKFSIELDDITFIEEYEENGEIIEGKCSITVREKGDFIVNTPYKELFKMKQKANKIGYNK